MDTAALEPEELSEKSDYLVKFLQNNTVEATSALAAGVPISSAVVTNMFGFRWYVGLLQNLHPTIKDDFVD